MDTIEPENQEVDEQGPDELDHKFEASQRYIVIGTLGHGKSTVLNTLMGDQDTATFEAKRSVKSVT